MRFFFLLLFFSCTGPGIAWAADHAVILVYHHIADDTPASTSIAPDTFAAQLDYLERNHFRVWALSRVLKALDDPEGLPDDIVAITFDDAYESVYSTAFPMLQARGWPFAVFAGTDAVDRGYNSYMSWSQMRSLAEQGVEIGNHSKSHAHLIRYLDGEDGETWQQRVKTEIDQAQTRIDTEIPQGVLKVFAYPYGEFTPELENLVGSMGYVGLGQQSGVASTTGVRTRVPRFPISSSFAGLDDFSLRVRARPLPVELLGPMGRVVQAGPAPVLRLRIGRGDFQRTALNCFASGQGRIPVVWENSGTIRIQATHPLKAGRSKYNCTAPSIEKPVSYYWYSHLWMSLNPDGGWYRE